MVAIPSATCKYLSRLFPCVSRLPTNPFGGVSKECNETKVFLAKHNFFPVALDCLRANRAHTKINQMGFMVVFEMLFEASESSKSADRPLDCVRFLPESFAHALEAGACK